MKRSNYLQGKCRKVYKLNESLDQSLLESDISIRDVCSSRKFVQKFLGLCVEWWCKNLIFGCV